MFLKVICHSHKLPVWTDNPNCDCQPGTGALDCKSLPVLPKQQKSFHSSMNAAECCNSGHPHFYCSLSLACLGRRETDDYFLYIQK